MAAQPQTVSVFVNKIGQDLLSFPKDKRHGTSPAHSPSPQEKVALALLHIRYNLALFFTWPYQAFPKKTNGLEVNSCLWPCGSEKF